MLIEIGRENHQISKDAFTANLLAKIKAQETRQVGHGQYLGYSGGYHQIRVGKQVISGTFTSNSGVLFGDIVWYERAIGQILATFKVKVKGG